MTSQDLSATSTAETQLVLHDISREIAIQLQKLAAENGTTPAREASRIIEGYLSENSND